MEKKSENVCMCVCVHIWVLNHFSHVWLYVIPWTIASQAPLSMGSSRQEYWSGQPFPSPGDPPDPGIEPMSLISPALASGFFTASATREAYLCVCVCIHNWITLLSHLRLTHCKSTIIQFLKILSLKKYKKFLPQCYSRSLFL